MIPIWLIAETTGIIDLAVCETPNVGTPPPVRTTGGERCVGTGGRSRRPAALAHPGCCRAAVAQPLPSAVAAVIDYQHAARCARRPSDPRADRRPAQAFTGPDRASRRSGCSTPTRSWPSSARPVAPEAFAEKRQAFEQDVGGVQRLAQERRRQLDQMAAVAMARSNSPDRVVGDLSEQRGFNSGAAELGSAAVLRPRSISPRRSWRSSTRGYPRSRPRPEPVNKKRMADARFFRDRGPFSLGQLAPMAGAELVGGRRRLLDPRRGDDRDAPTADHYLSSTSASPPAARRTRAGACLIARRWVAMLPASTAVPVCDAEPYARPRGSPAFYPDELPGPADAPPAPRSPGSACRCRRHPRSRGADRRRGRGRGARPAGCGLPVGANAVIGRVCCSAPTRASAPGPRLSHCLVGSAS